MLLARVGGAVGGGGKARKGHVDKEGVDEYEGKDGSTRATRESGLGQDLLNPIH